MRRLLPALAVLGGLLAAPAFAGLEEEIAAARAAAAPYADIRTAKRQGWRAFAGEAPLMGQHYNHPDGPDYVSGDRIDFARPSNLLYATIGGKTKLVAVAYVVRLSPGEPLPEGFSGSSDVWHVHDGAKVAAAIRETRPVIGSVVDRIVSRRVAHGDGRTRLAMVHLWLIPNPRGRFASHNPAMAYMDLGLPVERAGDMETAFGLALTRPDGCGEALDGKLWLSGAERQVERQIKAECSRSAARIAAARVQGVFWAESVASGEYRRLQRVLEARLGPDERRRMGALVEHGPGIVH
jgi:hypothetical protein